MGGGDRQEQWCCLLNNSIIMGVASTATVHAIWLHLFWWWCGSNLMPEFWAGAAPACGWPGREHTRTSRQHAFSGTRKKYLHLLPPHQLLGHELWPKFLGTTWNKINVHHFQSLLGHFLNIWWSWRIEWWLTSCHGSPPPLRLLFLFFFPFTLVSSRENFQIQQRLGGILFAAK